MSSLLVCSGRCDRILQAGPPKQKSVLRFWSLEVRAHGVSRVCFFFWVFQGESVPCLSSEASGGLLAILGVS